MKFSESIEGVDADKRFQPVQGVVGFFEYFSGSIPLEGNRFADADGVKSLLL